MLHNNAHIKLIVKDILKTLPKSSESSVIPEYYRFNENLEAHLDNLKDEHPKIYDLSINCGNNGWLQGFKTAINYSSKSLKTIKVNDESTEHQQIIIYDWSMFIVGIFSASFFWFLLILFFL